MKREILSKKNLKKIEEALMVEKNRLELAARYRGSPVEKWDRELETLATKLRELRERMPQEEEARGVREELEKIQAEKSRLKERLAEKDEEIKAYKKRISELESQVKKLTSKLASKEREVEGLTKKLEDWHSIIRRELDEAISFITQQSEEIKRLKAQIEIKDARLKELEDARW